MPALRNQVAITREIVGKAQRENRKFAQMLVAQQTISRLNYAPMDLLVFLDESGDLVMNIQNPFFCIGAVCILGQHYERLCGAWNILRHRVFHLERTESFHASSHLHKLSAASLEATANFLGALSARLIFGRQTPELKSLYPGEETSKNISLAMTLGSVQSVIEQLYPLALLRQRWVYEHADSLAWRVTQLTLSGDRWNIFPRPHGDLAFMRKGSGIVPGLELADLTSHLAWQRHRNFRVTRESRYRPLWAAAFPQLSDEAL